MAASINQAQIQWSAADSITLSSATRQDSDAVALDAADAAGAIQISADNAGTPTSGDVVDVYVKWTVGDTLGDTGDDYDTNEYAQFLCRLDTVAANTPGEDPARRTVPIAVMGKKALKLSIEAPQAASRNIVVRARIVTNRQQ